jgi:hypothetical protein
MDGNNNSVSSEQLPQRYRTQIIVLRIQRVYLLLTILGLFTLSLGLFGFEFRREYLEELISVIIFVIIYFGLRRRQGWVITLILIFSVFQGLGAFLKIIQPAEDIRSLVLKFVSCLLFFFAAYQLYFFRRKEVRALFGDQGVVLF